MKTIDYLYQQGCTLSSEFSRLIFKIKARYEDEKMIEILQWLRQIEGEQILDQTMTVSVVIRGYLEVLKWMQNEKIPMSQNLLSAATNCQRQNWLELFDHIHFSCSNQETDLVMSWAVHGGSLDRIQILETRGYRLHVNTCHIAAEKGHFDTCGMHIPKVI